MFASSLYCPLSFVLSNGWMKTLSLKFNPFPAQHLSCFSFRAYRQPFVLMSECECENVKVAEKCFSNLK
jgi:hypothetical protein